MKKIAIIYTTFLRDDLMMKTTDYIVDAYDEIFDLFIADQGDINEQKINYYKQLKQKINAKIFKLEFDCGLSFARNFLVQKAHTLGYEYCLITADSILFNHPLFYLKPIIKFLDQEPDCAIIGLDLQGRFNWEGTLDLEKGNQFIIKQLNIPKSTVIIKDTYKYYNVDVCRNFFIARTKALISSCWDNELKLGEHEDFFWRLKQTGWKCLYCPDYSAKYIKSSTPNYDMYRSRLYNDFKKLVQQKFKLKNWVKFIK